MIILYIIIFNDQAFWVEKFFFFSVCSDEHKRLWSHICFVVVVLLCFSSAVTIEMKWHQRVMSFSINMLSYLFVTLFDKCSLNLLSRYSGFSF